MIKIKPMHSKMHDESSYGPQTAIFLIHQRFLTESYSRHLDGTKLHWFNETSHSMNKLINRRWVAPPVLPPAVPTRYSPHSQQPTHWRTRIEPHYGPQLAILLSHQQFLTESCIRHLKGVKLGLNNIGCCSVSENVSEHWTVHPALSPPVQMTDSPVVRTQTHSKTRIKPCYGPQMAIAPLHPRFHRESCCHHLLDGSKLSRGALAEHDNNIGHHRLVDLMINTHRKDVCVRPASASTWC
jgi:hypothetical protein